MAGDGRDQWLHSVLSPRTLEGWSNHPAWSAGALPHSIRSACHTSVYEFTVLWTAALFCRCFFPSVAVMPGWAMAVCYLRRFKPVLGMLVPGTHHQSDFAGNSLRNHSGAAALSHIWDSDELESHSSPAKHQPQRPESRSAPYLPQISYLQLFIYLLLTGD